MKTCSVEGCASKVLARGWCRKHYKRWYTHGDPMKVSIIVGDDYVRFDSYVNKTDTCWLWEGCTNVDGYGDLRINNRMTLAHRYNYDRYVGPIPEGMCVLHKCDTPSCVRPSCLELGTKADNNRQRAERGRHTSLHGELSPNAKLTTEHVHRIRNSQETLTHMAEVLGVAISTVANVKHRKTWRHLP